MSLYRLFIFCIIFVSAYGIEEQKYNETEYNPLQQFLGIPLPTLKLPDLLNPDKSDNSPSIQNQITQEKLINIGLPTVKLPNLLPTALPSIKLPTIKIPDLFPTAVPTVKIPNVVPKTLPTIPPFKLPTIKFTLPHILPTAFPTIPPFKIPTIKIPTLPHILPTAFPTLFPKPTKPSEGVTPNTPYTLPYPLPSDVVPIPFLNNETDVRGNLVCEICEDAVVAVKGRFFKLEKKVRDWMTTGLGKICDMLMSNPATMVLATPCNLIKSNIVDNVFKKLDKFEDSIQPVSFCKHVPFCK